MEKLLAVFEELIWELDDAVDFMETLSEYEDEEGEKRRVDKIDLVNRAINLLAEFKEED